MKELKNFFKWFFINQFLGILYLCVFLAGVVQNVTLAILFVVLFGIGVLTTWTGMTVNAYKIWKSEE